MKFKKMVSLLGITLAGMHIANQYTAKSVKSLFLHDKYNDYNYNWTYGNIFYTKQGIGTPLLFIHDLTPASSTFEWKELITEYSKTHTLYALDLLGCGFSDKPQMTYTNYVFVKLITDFIRDIIKEPCTIITSGASSTIALTSTLEDNSMIKKIIMINPSDIENETSPLTEKNKKMNFLLQLPIIGTFISNYYNRREVYEDLFYNDYFYNCYSVDQSLIEAYFSAYHQGKETSKSLYASICNHYTNMDFTLALSKLTIPVSIIFGEGEPHQKETLEVYQNYADNLTHTVLPETKHLPALERPDELIQLLNEML